MLKFYWNGIRESNGGAFGPLQLCSYHRGALKHHPDGTITIYGKRYRPFSSGVCKAFEVKDDTEIQSDYIVNEHIRVLPTHPLYAQVFAAMQQATMHYAKQWAKRDTRQSEAQAKEYGICIG
jgi:hypothetical protein